MCVIMIGEKVRPTTGMIAAAFDANDAGAGIAWRENGIVKWEKGLDLEKITKYCEEKPLPYVTHFRIPSVGGKCPELCHPFPISRDVTTNLKGSTKGYVLFHNGHWNVWRDKLLDSLIKRDEAVPKGKWSDSRTLAWMAYRYGHNVLNITEEKVVVFSPTDHDIFGPATGWSEIQGVWCSNTIWENRGKWQRTGRQYWWGNKWQDVPEPKGEPWSHPYMTPPASIVPDDKKEIIDVSLMVDKELRGASTESPFERFKEAKILFELGHLSKSKWKKAKKAWEREQAKDYMKAKTTPVMPELVRH
jgi:hypothetical protein